MEQNNLQGQVNNQTSGQPTPVVQPVQNNAQQPVSQEIPTFQTSGGQDVGTQTPQFSGDHEIIKVSGSHQGSYKIIIIIFLVIVIIAAIVYGVIMFKSGSGNNPLTSLNAPPTPVVAAPTSIPIPVVLSQEETDVDAVDVGTADSSLQDIDQDVQSL